LEDLAEKTRKAANRQELATLLGHHLRQALHPAAQTVYLESSRGWNPLPLRYPCWLSLQSAATRGRCHRRKPAMPTHFRSCHPYGRTAWCRSWAATRA
jgi:hypothetical protein